MIWWMPSNFISGSDQHINHEKLLFFIVKINWSRKCPASFCVYSANVCIQLTYHWYFSHLLHTSIHKLVLSSFDFRDNFSLICSTLWCYHTVFLLFVESEYYWPLHIPSIFFVRVLTSGIIFYNVSIPVFWSLSVGCRKATASCVWSIALLYMPQQGSYTCCWNKFFFVICNLIHREIQ
jgi:hypothetical protein